MKVSVEDLVCLHLYCCDPIEAGDPVPYGRSVPGICEVLDVNRERMAESVELLSALTELRSSEFLAERQASVDRLGEDHTVYELTEDGQTRAVEIRERVRSNQDSIHVIEPDGSRVDCPFSDLGRYFETSPLVSGLARLTEQGVLSLETTIEREFVNRSHELAVLEGLPAAQQTAVFVQGRAGVGKTALLETARSRLEFGAVSVEIGGCSADTAQPYEPFVRALGGLPTTISPGPAQDLDDDTFANHRSVLFDAVSNELRDRAGEGTFVVALEDLHWADSATIELLTALLEQLEPADGVRLVCTYREPDADDHALWTALQESDNETEHLVLESFDREITREYIEVILGTRDVPVSFVDRIFETTGGMALFVEETVEQLLDSGVLEPEIGVYPDDTDTVDVPETVRESIDRRLDALGTDAFELLAWGAVAGDPIPVEPLLSAIELPAIRIREYVDVLVDARLWQRDDDGAITFTSEVIRQTVLDRIEDAHERHLHEGIAEAIIDEESTGNRAGNRSTADRIAHHLEQAGADKRAIEYYLEAGDAALDVYASDVAIDRFKRAVSLGTTLGHDEVVVDAIERMGRARFLAGEFEEADKHFEYVKDHAADVTGQADRNNTADTGDADRTFMRASLYLARIRNNRGSYTEGIERATAGLERWNETDTLPEACRLLNCIGWAMMNQGDLEDAIDHYGRARDLAETLDDTDELLPAALAGLGTTLVYQNEADEAIETLQQAISLLEDSHRRRLLAKSLNNLGVVHFNGRNLGPAKAAFERSLSIYQATGDRATTPTVMMNVGLIDFEKGDWDEALATYEESLDLAKDIDLDRMIPFIFTNIATIDLHRGALEAAKGKLDRALSLTDEMGMTTHSFKARFYRCEYYYLRDELDAAVEDVRQGIHDAAEIGEPTRAATSHEWLGRIAHERGDPEKAIVLLERAVALADESDEGVAVNPRCYLATALLAVGRLDEAAALIDEADELANAGGNVLHRIAIDRARSRLLERQKTIDESHQALDDALERALSVDSILEEARTRYRLGQLANQFGSKSTATEHFDEVGRIAEAHGFERLRKRVKNRTADTTR